MSATALPPASPGLTDGEFYWNGAASGQLMILRCQRCHTYIHLPRPVCPACAAFDLLPEQVSGRGTVYALTKTFKAFHPSFVDRVPYLLAAVELVEQPRLIVFSNLVATPDQEPHIGMAVDVDFEDRGEVTVPVFRPSGTAR